MVTQLTPVGRSSFLSDVTVALLGSLASRLVMIVALAVSAKYFFTPQQIGHWATVYAIAMFLVPLGTFRYETALVLPVKDVNAASLGIGAFVSALVMTVMLSVLVYIGMLDRFTGADFPLILLACVPGLFLAQCTRNLSFAWLARKKRFVQYSIIDFLQAVVIAIFLLIAGLQFGQLQEGFAVANAVGLIIGASMASVAATYYLPRGWLREFSGARTVSQMRQYVAYPKYLTVYSLSSGLLLHVFIVVLALRYDSAVAGAYLLASRLVYMPSSLLVAPLRQVFYSYGKVAADQLDEETLHRVRRLLMFLAIVVPVAVQFVNQFGLAQVSAFLGEEFDESVSFMSILIYIGAVNVLTGWLDRTYDLLGKQRLSVVLQVSADLIIFSTTLFVVVVGYGAITAIIVFAVLMFGYEMIWLFLTLRMIGLRRKFLTQFYAMFGISILIMLAVSFYGGR